MADPGADPLLLGLSVGDERAFGVLFDRFSPRLYRAAARILGRREDAEDAVQDVFLAVVRSKERLTEVRDMAAYLFASLHRAANKRAAQRARLPVIQPVAIDAFHTPANTETTDRSDYDRLQWAIEQLSASQREVLALRIDGELTFAQIAQVLSVGLNTACSRYRYGLKRLKTLLGGEADRDQGATPASKDNLRDADGIRRTVLGI